MPGAGGTSYGIGATMRDVTEPASRSPRPPIRWWPDDSSALILAAYARRRDKRGDVFRRALRMLAIADGILDPRGRIRTDREAGKP
jgi:hypothetical protein